LGIRLSSAARSPKLRGDVLPACRGGRRTMAARRTNMNRMKEERHEDTTRPGKGDTVTAQGENQAPKARQPHERDESADSQSADNSSAERMGGMAHDAVVDGQQDTTKGQELDATYHRLQQDSAPAPQDKRNQTRR
jgi:hypothetical protein